MQTIEVCEYIKIKIGEKDAFFHSDHLCLQYTPGPKRKQGGEKARPGRRHMDRASGNMLF